MESVFCNYCDFIRRRVIVTGIPRFYEVIDLIVLHLRPLVYLVMHGRRVLYLRPFGRFFSL